MKKASTSAIGAPGWSDSLMPISRQTISVTPRRCSTTRRAPGSSEASQFSIVSSDVNAHLLAGHSLDLDGAALLLPVHLGVAELAVGLALDAQERAHRVDGGLLALA